MIFKYFSEDYSDTLHAYSRVADVVTEMYDDKLKSMNITEKEPYNRNVYKYCMNELKAFGGFGETT